MPVYHLILHAYGSYLPDHDDGSHHRRRGFRPPNKDGLAESYRRRQRAPTVTLSIDAQRAVIDQAAEAAGCQALRLHAVACEPTHVHAVVSWADEARAPLRVRASIKSAVTRRLNVDFGRRQWFGGRGAMTRVWDAGQLRYLVEMYLPKHRGEQWYEASRREPEPEPRRGPAFGTSPDISIRPAASAADVAAAVGVVREAAAWLAETGRALWLADEIDAAHFEAAAARGELYVGVAGDGVVATMLLQPLDPLFWPEAAAGEALYVHRLAVRRMVAGQGVSTAMLDFAAGECRRRRIPRLRLDCEPRPALRAIYERHGFVLRDVGTFGRFKACRYERVSNPSSAPPPSP